MVYFREKKPLVFDNFKIFLMEKCEFLRKKKSFCAKKRGVLSKKKVVFIDFFANETRISAKKRRFFMKKSAFF